MKPVIFDEDAEAEFRRAIAYFDSQRPNLGLGLQEEVEVAVKRIAAMPDRFSPHGREEVRKLRVRRFPYTIYFLELDESIRSVAIAHQKRRPDYWKRRLL